MFGGSNNFNTPASTGGGIGLGAGLLSAAGGYGGIISLGTGIITDIFGGGPSSWGSPELKQYATSYVSQAALDRIPMSARMSQAAFMEAYAQALVQLNWGPQENDPNKAWIVQRIAQIKAMQGQQVQVDAQGNPVSTTPGTVRFYWPWEKGAFTNAKWWNWLVWVLIVAFVVFLLYRALRNPKRQYRRWKQWLKRRANRSRA